MTCPYYGKEYCGKYEDLRCPYYYNVCGQGVNCDVGLCGILYFNEDFNGPKLSELPKKAKQYTYKYYE